MKKKKAKTEYIPIKEEAREKKEALGRIIMKAILDYEVYKEKGDWQKVY